MGWAWERRGGADHKQGRCGPHRSSPPAALQRARHALGRKGLARRGVNAESHAIDTATAHREPTMNIAHSRFTISTIAVAACAMVALVAAAPAQAQAAEAGVQRIEIVGQRPIPLQRIEIVGKRIAEPGVQRIEIVGQRLRSERVAAAVQKAAAL
jgi:hypothetical protein